MSANCNNHKNCINDALEKAKIICDDNNISLTPIRKKILKLIWDEGHVPVKAYDLLEKLKIEDPNAKIVTIYRALDFLQNNGLIHKLESQNSFVGCNHPTRQHNCTFLICSNCKEVNEFCNNAKIINLIEDNINKKDFLINNIILEVHGLCNKCKR